MGRLRRTRPVRRCHDVLRSANHASRECVIVLGKAEFPGIIHSNPEHYCQMCGVMFGEIDDNTGQRVELFILETEAGTPGEVELADVRAVCSTCFSGAQQLYKEAASADRALSHDDGSGRPSEPIFSALLEEIGNAKWAGDCRS